MKKVLKFVKGKRDDRRERVSPNTALSSSENLHSPTEIMTLGDGIEACDGQKYYLDISGRDKSVTKLHKAAWQGNLDKVKAVMKKADIDIPDKLNRTPLHLAAACGHNSIVHFLITNNARMDIRDSEGKTPLLKAAECGQKEVIVTLLDRGGDLHSVDFEGNSPLHLSVKNCFYDLSVLLLKKGANFELPNKDGDIPLHVATAVEQSDIVELLLRYGSDVNVLSGDMTPLMIAARLGNADLVKLFLDYGADCKLKDVNGWTAEDHAQMTSNQSVIPYLQTDIQALARHAEKNADTRVDEGIRTLSTFKGAGEKGVKDKEEEKKYSCHKISEFEKSSKELLFARKLMAEKFQPEEESNSAAKEASDGNEDNSDTWNDSQVSEKPINAKIDKVKLQAFLQDSDGDENKSNKGERGQPEGGDTDVGMDTEGGGRGNMAGRADLQDSPKSCPTPPPLKPPRSWDFLQTGVVGCPGNTNSQHQNSKPRQRSLFTMPTRDENCDGPKTDTFVEEVIKVSRASSLNESSSMEKSDNSGISCLERNEGHSSKSIYESSPRDPWKLRGKAAKERSKENKRESKEGIVDIIKENKEEIKQEIIDVIDGAASALIKEVEDDLVVVYSDASDWESSSGGDGSIGSSDEVDLPMDNLPILVLPENEDESSKPIREEGRRKMSAKLGITEEEEDDESLSVAALSPATSSVSERRNRFLQRSQSIDLGDEDLTTEDETAMENEEEEDVYGMRKKSDGGGTEPSETASREMTTVLEVEGPRLQGKNIPSLGAVGREDTLHGYEEVWESNPQLCPRSCSRGSSSEGPHSPSTPRSPFLEVGFPGRREDRLHPFGRSRSSVGDSDHRSGDEYTSTKTNRRRSEESDRKQELVNNGYRDCLPKDLRMIPKKPNLSESEGESHPVPSIDVEYSEKKIEDIPEGNSIQTADISAKVQDEVFVALEKTKIGMVVEDEEISLNGNNRKEFKMYVEDECIQNKMISEVQCSAELSSKTIPIIHMADKANAQTWNVRVDTEMEVEFQMNNDNEKPSLGKGLLKPATRSPPYEESEGEDSVFLDDDEVKDEKKVAAQGLVGPLGWGGVSWRVGGATPWRGGAGRNLGPLPSSPQSLGENGPEPISLSAADHNSRPHMSSAHSLPSQLSHLALHEEKEDIFNAPINLADSAHSTKDAQSESSTNLKLKETRGYSSLDQAEDIRSKVHMAEKNTNKLSVMLSLPRNMEQMNLDEDDMETTAKSKAEENEDKKHRTEETIRRSLSEISSQDQLPRTPKRKKTQRSSSLQASHPPETPERSPNRTNPGILKRACSMGKNIVPTKGPPMPQGKDFALLVSSEKDRPQRPSDIKVIEIPCSADNVLSPPILVSPQEYRSMKAEEFRLREDRRSLDDGRSKEDVRRKDKARAKLESKSESREETRGRLKRYERIDSSEGKPKESRRHSGNIREEFMATVDSERPPKRPPRRHKSLTSETHRSSSPLVKRSLSLSGQASMAAALGQTRVSQRVVQVEIMAQQQRRRKRRRAALLHPSLDKNDPGAMGGSTEEEEDRRRWETHHRTQSRETAGGSSLRALERRQRLDPADADGCPSSKDSDNSLDGYKVGGSEDEDSESSSEDMDSPAKARALMGRSKEELADGSKREKDRNFNSHSGKVNRGHRVPIAMREQLRASAEERGRLEGEACRLEEQLQTLTWEAEEAREGERAAAALVAALAARVTRLEADTARLAEVGARAKLRIANREQEVMHLREVCMKYEEQKQNLSEIIRLKSIERENLERKLADKEEEEKSRKMENKSNSNELEARLNLLEQERQILERSNSRLENELESLRAELEEVRKGVLMGVSSAKAEAEGKVEARLSKELRELQEEVQQWKEKYECSLKVTKEDRNELKKESSSDAEAQVEIPSIELTPVERRDGEVQVNTVGDFDTTSALAADGWRPPLARGKSLPAQTRAFLRDAATNTPTLPAPNAQALAAAKAKELELTKELIREREKTRKNAHMIKKLRAEIQALKKGMEDAARMAAEAKEEEMKKKIAEMQERNELGAFGDEFGPVSEDVTELRKQVADLESMLSKESSSRESLQNQIGKLMEDLQSMSIANCKLKEEKSNIEQELSSALVRLEAEENGWRREVERLGRAHQGEMERARAEARNELSARLSQLNQFLQQQAQEQSRLEKQRMNSEAQLIREFEETKRQLLGEIATLQAALQVKGEEERELRQKCDRLLRENDRREEQRRKRLVERAYSVNFPPAEPIFDLSREKPAPTSVSFSGAPIGGEGLPSPPSPLQSKSHIIPAPPAFLERGKVGMTSSLSLPKPPPVVFLSPPPPGRDALRRELDRSIRKHGRTESLDLEHLRAMAPEKPSTDERLEILRKKYFLP